MKNKENKMMTEKNMQKTSQNSRTAIDKSEKIVYNTLMKNKNNNKTKQTGLGRHPLTKKDTNMFKTDFEITFNDNRVKVFASTIMRCSKNGLRATGEILSTGKWTTVSLEPHVASLKRIASSDFGVVQSVAKSLVRDFEAV